MLGVASISAVALSAVFDPLSASELEDLMGGGVVGVSDEELGDMRGGFISANGLLLRFGLESSTKVNGNVERKTRVLISALDTKMDKMADKFAGKSGPETVFAFTNNQGAGNQGTGNQGADSQGAGNKDSSSPNNVTLVLSEAPAKFAQPVPQSTAQSAPQTTPVVDTVVAAVGTAVDAITPDLTQGSPAAPHHGGDNVDLPVPGAQFGSGPLTDSGPSVDGHQGFEPGPEAAGPQVKPQFRTVDLKPAETPVPQGGQHGAKGKGGPKPVVIEVETLGDSQFSDLSPGQVVDSSVIRRLLSGGPVVVNSDNNAVIQEFRTVTVDIANFSEINAQAITDRFSTSIVDLVSSQILFSLSR